MENKIEDDKMHTFYGSFVDRMIHTVALAFKPHFKRAAVCRQITKEASTSLDGFGALRHFSETTHSIL